MEYIAEPFKIKSVEPLKILSREEREQRIKEEGYNLFNLRAEYVYIDLMTDSGTGAMSDRQWASLLSGDESYAGSESFFRFEETVRKITGKQYIIPTHQGRSAENLFFAAVMKAGEVVPNNSHFDTTEANIESKGGCATNLPCAESRDLSGEEPFKGNIDLEALDALLSDPEKRVPVVMITVTNNTGGGQPVSMQNLRCARAICDKYETPLYFDSARYAENCYFIKTREPGYEDKSLLEIANEMFSLCDGALMSAKKDGYVNIGGWLATDDESIFARVRELMVVVEGFTTYGGLAGRDMDAMAVGLMEALDEDYMRQRVEQVGYLHTMLKDAGVPMINPYGGHAVYLDANSILPDLPVERFRGWSLANELYIRGGIRSVEIGAVMFMKQNPDTGETIYPDKDLVRLAVPRRVYTNRHMDFVAQTVIELSKNSKDVRGYKITYAPRHLKHFIAEFIPAE